jgi:hypothetical protein
MSNLNILILGASYGSLLATKILLAGHDVTLVCTPGTADLINRVGTRVRFPVKGQDTCIDVDSTQLPGWLQAAAPDQVRVTDFDLVCLAMQEPQYGASGVKPLMMAIADHRIPCLSIMNMPPLPYLARVISDPVENYATCYQDAEVWKNFDPDLVTLCSPDPQAFRPDPQQPQVLQVGLATNFKAAVFGNDAANQVLRELEHSMTESQWRGQDLPVKLKVHESLYVPLAKWCMLMTGNYRCVLADSVQPIQTAVHENIDQSQAVYEWTRQLCFKLGAAEQDLVPFEKYAQAAQSLSKPSSVARALAAGARNVERLDLLAQSIAKHLGLDTSLITPTVAHVDGWLHRNRKAINTGP